MSFTVKDTNKIKGIAIILMIIHHCFLRPIRYRGYEVIFSPLSEKAVNQIALSMKICVAIFVLLSAYGITISLKSINEKYELKAKEYFKVQTRRWIKMMSGFLFVFILLQLYSAVSGIGWYSVKYGTGLKSILYFVIDMFGLAKLFHTPTFVATFWYMSLAQIIIVIMPIMLIVYKKFGADILVIITTVTSVGMIFLLPESYYAYYPVYSLCIVAGIIAADKSLFVKWKEFNIIKNHTWLNKIAKCMLYLLIIGICMYLRQISLGRKYLLLWEACSSLAIIGFSFEFINGIPVLGKCLEIFGTYSMNIFLIHNFIRTCWYKDFTYSFKYAPVIVIVLFSISLIISVIIEKIKKYSGWNKIVKRTVNNI